MNIVIATGIYPPAIGGIATYAKGLCEALKELGHDVRVITYGDVRKYESTEVICVEKKGIFLVRWRRYAKALKNIANDADVVIALSSVSVGIPLMLARLKKPKKILRLGGDFFWERYTDGGGMLGLQDWYASRFGLWKLINGCFMEAILRSFDQLVYSTEFQRKIHAEVFSGLPQSSVIENSGTNLIPGTSPILHEAHTPFRLLSYSRFVGFKNLSALIRALKDIPDAQLTMVGDGPLFYKLQHEAEALKLGERVAFHPPVGREEILKIFSQHDLLVVPSLTEISPNAALEARSAGLPVLLTDKTGLDTKAEGFKVTALESPHQISTAVAFVRTNYAAIAQNAVKPYPKRSWSTVADEWNTLLKSL